MADVRGTTIGSVLTIDDELLRKLDSVDRSIAKLQETSKTMANSIDADFRRLASGGIDEFIQKLSHLTQTMGGIGATLGGGLSITNSGVGNLGTGITNAANNIERLLAQMRGIGVEGASHIMAAKLAVDKLIEAMQYRNTGSIALITEEIKGIDKQLKDTENLLTKTEQDALVERKRLLQEELKEAQRTQREREVNLQRTLDRMATAQERYQKKIQQSYKKTAEEYKAQNYAKNTTYQGALDFADSANSINRRLKAIEYLREARAKLNVKEDEYAKKLADINAAIKRLDKANRDAVESSKNLGTAYESLTKRHTRLLDNAGQLQRAFALLFSVSQVRGYISQIAKIRGEFELQQRSLQAILQNKTEADAIFNKTVALAVQSPFQIKDLISYTKQLAAYRIESDKLYDTTKRLADVSAGLGVDMQRLILAYGQVKAAAYLRGTEVRQFTEAGINLYGELQAYFKEVRGEAYTTAQIVDMISKRMVTFEDIEAVFKRITDQGGIFYNMQAIQAETLQGKIANLRDSIDVMLNDIGRANEGTFKSAIDGANLVIRNWQLLSDVGLRLVEILALVKLHSIMTGASMNVVFTRVARFEKLSSVNTRLGALNTMLGMLSLSFRNFAKAVGTAGLMVKAAMAQFVPILILTEVWQAISRIIDLSSEYNKTIRESTQAYADETAKINKITNAIRELQKAKEDAVKSDNKTFDYKQNWEMQKSNLQTLYERLKEEKLEVPLELSKVTQENINEVVEDARRKLQLGYQMIADTQRELAGNNNSFFLGNGQGFQSMLPDNFDADMNDLENAAADVKSYATRIQASIALVGEQYKYLDEVSKKAYDSIKDGARKGEVDVNYVIRAYEQLEAIINGYAVDNPMLKATREQFNDYANSILGLKTQIDGIWQFNSQKETATKQLQSLFDSIDAIYGAELAKLKPAEVKVEFDKVATAAKLQDLERYILLEIAAKKYKFKVEGDENDLAKQLNWVDDYIRKYFAGRKYSATISLQTNVDAMEDFIKKGDAEAKIAQTAKKFVERFSRSVKKNAKKVIVDESLLNLLGTPYKIGSEVDANIVLARAREILAKATDLSKNGYGVDPFDKNGTKAAKAQRDLIKERIEAYKELQSQYEKYLKMYDKETAKEKALESLKYKLQNAGIYNDVLGIFPDEKTIAEKIKGLAAQFKDLSKRGDAYKVVADLVLQYDEQKNTEELDKAKRAVEEAFSGYDLYNDLTKMGIGDAYIRDVFGNIPKTFEEIQKEISDVYLGKEGKDAVKQREEAEKKLQEKIRKYNLDTFKELTQNYSNTMKSQLEIDSWYFTERNKIINNPNIKGDTRSQYLANLEKIYSKKSDENIWNEFKNSDMYIKLFENLDSTSKRVLTVMKERLDGMRDSLKNLSPEQVKQVTKAIEDVESKLIAKNPFAGLTKNIKEYISYMGKRKSIEEQYIRSLQKEQKLSKESTEQKRVVDNALEAWDLAVKKYGVASKEAILLSVQYKSEKEKLDVLLKELVAQKKITEEEAKQIQNGDKNANNLKERLAALNTQISEISSGWSDFSTMLENFGFEVPEEIGKVLNGFNQIGKGLQQILSGNIIGGTLTFLSGIGNTIGSIFGFGNNDKKLQKEIENQERAIRRLQNAYDDLKTAIDNAWSSEDTINATEDAINNLEKQNEAIRAMIAAESDKKDSDDDKIEEWQEQMKDNVKQIKEIREQILSDMGGFGSQSNYKSAAQEFADAWVDAFNEGEDTLRALEDKFDDFFNNMLKKQLMQRAAKLYLEPIMKAFDEAVSEGSAGGNNGYDVTKEELQTIKDLKDENLAAFNEYAKTLMDVLGVMPTDTSTLSDLQKGIQGLSESTGQALEGLLNSIRYYVAKQSDDISVIRSLINASVSAFGSQMGDSATLSELRTQTSVLREIRDMFSDVTKMGHPRNGRGIKVFTD